MEPSDADSFPFEPKIFSLAWFDLPYKQQNKLGQEAPGQTIIN